MNKSVYFILLIIFSLVLSSCSNVDETNSAESISVDSQDEGLLNNIGSDSVSVSNGIKTVVIENMEFNPADLEINVGDTVEWVNKDSVKHTVTFEDARIDVQIAVGGTVTYTFAQEGEARYFCSLHPSMQGVIFVN